MYEKLTHLTADKFADLLHKYYDPEREFTVAEIVAEYDIDARPSELSSLFPEVVHEELCPYCTSTHIVSRARSRSALSDELPFCPQCMHRQIGYCTCENCRRQAVSQQETEKKQQRKSVLETYDIENLEVPAPITLPLREAIFLKSVVSHKTTEDLYFIEPFKFT